MVAFIVLFCNEFTLRNLGNFFILQKLKAQRNYFVRASPAHYTRGAISVFPHIEYQPKETLMLVLVSSLYPNELALLAATQRLTV